MNGPYFAHWLTVGTICLIVICLAFAALYWIDNYLSAHRNEAATRRDEAILEQARRNRALKIVNDLTPLSDRVRRLP